MLTREEEKDEWVNVDLTSVTAEVKTASEIFSSGDGVKLMTYNIACLPTEIGIWPFKIHKQINGDFLAANVDRAKEICDAINFWNQTYYVKVHTTLTIAGVAKDLATIVNQYLLGSQYTDMHLFPSGVEVENPPILPDIIGFQEAFDPDVRRVLAEKLAVFYPNHTDLIDRKDQFWQVAGSGLMIFTKSPYKILDMDFRPYMFKLPGEELFVDKGFLAIKVSCGLRQYQTIYTTHLPGGGAVFKNILAKLGVTASEIRGLAFGQMQHHTVTENWPEKVITAHPEFKNVNTKCMGDFNVKLNSKDNMESISTGMSANHKVKGKPKYPGQFLWAKFYAHNKPDNFIESREEPVLPRPKKPNEKISKVYKDSALKEAKEKGFFLGSTMRPERLKSGKPMEPFDIQSTEPKMFDGIFINQDADVNMKTRLYAGLSRRSDHYVLFGCEEKKEDAPVSIPVKVGIHK